MTATPSTIALVGCGSWGRLILRDLVALGCEVPVVARSAASRERAREGGASVVVDAIASLPPIDGAVVSTPTTTHAEVVEELLGLHVPIYVEKPLTQDLRSAERVVAAAAGRVFVMDKWRYHPGVLCLAEIARSGELGPVVGLRTTRVGWAKHLLDVDAVWHLLPHDLAIGLEILGELPPVRSAVAEREGSAVTGMIATLGERPWLVAEVSERRRRHFREVRLFCEGGSAVLADSYSDHVAIHRASDEHPVEPPAAELRSIDTTMPLLAELEAFVGHVHGGPPPKSSAEDALAIVRAIDLLRRSAGIEEKEA